jgi:two-component system sensor histidine kinase CreC
VKIRTAIFGVYVAASAAGFAIMMALVLRDVRFRYVESMRRTLGDTAMFLAAHVAQDLPADDAWSRQLATLPPKADLLRVFACDQGGRVVFDSAGGADIGKVYAWAKQRAETPSGGEAPDATPYEVFNGELRVATPIRRDGGVIGWVGVGRPMTTVVESIRRARWSLVWSLGSVAAVMVLAGWWIASRLTHSLERLTEYALAVRDGRQVSPPQSKAKEVAALARAFEEMRVALEGKAYVERYTQALAHEIKAPLSSIRGAAELLAENPPSPDRERFVANLCAESDRLRQIVDRLLELASLEARRAGLARPIIELESVVREAHAAALGTAASRQVRLSCTVRSGAAVRGDVFLLTQALGNLIQNALEFSPEGGSVSVELAAEGGRAIVIIDDDGPGVPEYALARVFERFFSLPRPDTGRKSSGLGLSIVREIARLHGGEVRLENRSTGGARACFLLPAA